MKILKKRNNRDFTKNTILRLMWKTYYIKSLAIQVFFIRFQII